MLLSAIIDGMAVQETIFGAGYEPQAALDVLRGILSAVVPRAGDPMEDGGRG